MIRFFLSLLVGAAALLGGVSAAAQSTCDTTVTTLADSGAGSLRDALNSYYSQNICFSVSGTITLASTLTVNHSLSINGSGITLSGNNQVQAIDVYYEPIQVVGVDPSVSSTINVSISGMTITSALNSGIENDTGNLTLNAVTLTGNQGGSNGGGGLQNYASATLVNSTVSNNTANVTGGGIYNASGATLTLTNTTLSGNHCVQVNGVACEGGAIYSAGTLNIQGGVITQNIADSFASALKNYQGTLTITGGTQITSNSGATGVLINLGTGTIQNAYFAGNTSIGYGGAITNGSTLTVSGTTFNANNASAVGSAPGQGGAIENDGGTLTLDEDTFASNIAPGLGGAIYNNGALAITSTTVSDNVSYTGGAGIYDASDGQYPESANNNIFSGNGSTGDCEGCTWVSTSDNLVGGSANLGPLANNSPANPVTQMTFMPLPGSPVIAAGNVSVNPDSTDQRGLSRTTNSTIDLGSVQTHYSSVSFYAQPSTTTAGQAIAPPVVVQALEIDGNTANFPEGVPITVSLLNSQGGSTTATLSGSLTEEQTLNAGVYGGTFADLSVNNAGSYELFASIEPAYGTQAPTTFYAVSSPFTITAAQPVATAPTVLLAIPPVLLPDTPLNTTNMHASAVNASGVLVPGTYTYSPALGSTPAAGQHTATVNFTPTDTTDYLPASATASFTVATPVGTVTSLTASPNPAAAGASVTLSANVTPASGDFGVVAGSEAFSTGGAALATQALALDRTVANFKAGAPQSFTPRNTYVNDFSTYGADFNGDGVTDLLFSTGQEFLGLQLAQLNGTLGATISLDLGTSCAALVSMAVGDVNGDGLPDIVALCNNGDSTGGSLSVLINRGAGSFALISTQAASYYSYDAKPVLGDFNGDGKPDMVVVDGCTSGATYTCLAFFQGDGQGGFTLASSTSMAGTTQNYDSYAAPLAADFNKDGTLDLAFIHTSSNNPNGVVDIWKNNGGTAPTFGIPIPTTCAACYDADATIQAGASSVLASLVSADFNRDGLADLALVTITNGSGANSTYSVALNTTTGGTLAFPTTTTDVDSDGAEAVATADFDGDGVPDLALYSYSDNTVRVLLGAGDGTFSAAAPQLFATVNPPTTNNFGAVHPQSKRARHSQGSAPSSSYYNGEYYPTLTTGDTNGDGIPDLIVGQLTFDASSGAASLSGTQFITNGATLASTTTQAPAAASTPYAASTTPADRYWAGSQGTTTLQGVILATQTALSVAPPTVTYGQAATVTATVTNLASGGAVSGGSVSFTLDGTVLGTTNVANGAASFVTASLISAGQHTVGATYSGTTVEASSTAPNATLTINRATPTLTWPTPAAINSTTPLSGTQLDATATGVTSATLAGSYVYTPPAGTTLSPGTHTLSVTFAPADTTDYTTASGSVQIQVANTGTATTLSVMPATPTYGQALTLTATVANTGGTSPVNGGTVQFLADGNGIANGTVSVANGTAALAGIQLGAGSHVFTAVYSGTSGENGSSSQGLTIQVAKASAALAWPTPATISTTTPLSAAQLDASATGITAGTALAGSFVYTPAAGTTLSVGSHTLSVSFTPTDITDYNTATATVQIQVVNTNTATTLTVAPTSATYGQALTLTANVLNNPGNTPVTGGTVQFSSDGTVLGTAPLANGVATLASVQLAGGSHLLSAVYSGTSGEGSSTSPNDTIVIAKANPTLTWPTPAAISTTTPLSSTQLDASATGITAGTALAGSFVYSPTAGTTLSAGSHTLSVTFTPTDITDYNTATATVQIQVANTNTATTLTVAPTSATYGQALTLTASVVNAPGSTPVTGGTVQYSSDGAAIGTAAVTNGVATLGSVQLAAGSHALTAVYSGTSGEGGSSSTATTIQIAKATPTLAWTSPAAISTTTPLSVVQLDASATGVTAGTALAGSFAYTPVAGTTLSVGTHTLSVTFTPTDITDYTTASDTVQIQVVTTNTQTSLTIPLSQRIYGQPLTLTAQVSNLTGTAPVSGGSVVFSSDGNPLGTVALTNGSATLTGIQLSAGQHVIGAAYSGTAGEGPSSAPNDVIQIAKLAPVLTWPTPAPITSTTALSAAQLDATATGLAGAELPGTFTYTPAAGTNLAPGTYTLSVAFTPTDAVDYSSATGTVQLQVAAETILLSAVSPASADLGTSPVPITLTAQGFPRTAVIELGGTPLPTTVLSATQLSASIPAASLKTPGMLSLTIYDAFSKAISNTLPFTVVAQPAAATVAAPTTSVSGEQPTVAVTLATAYPVDLNGVFTLTFQPSSPNGVDDPNGIVFSNGSRTYDFTIPAGSLTVPPVGFMTGTVQGTVTITLQLTAGTSNVTPPDLAPTNIAIPAGVPVIDSVTFTNTTGAITVDVLGFSNTREMTLASFTFTGPGAGDLSAVSVPIPAVDLFAAWYTTSASDAFGSQFLYTQSFQLSDSTTNITGVSVTLSNSVGTSTSVNSQ